MRRTPTWAVLALLPLAGAAVILSAPDDVTKAPAFLPNSPLVVEYWFLLVVVLLIVQMLFFAVHAWRNPKVGHNKRLLWVMGIALFAIISTPLYGWAYSDPAT